MCRKIKTSHLLLALPAQHPQLAGQPGVRNRSDSAGRSKMAPRLAAMVSSILAFTSIWIGHLTQVRAEQDPEPVTEFVEMYYLRDSWYACKLLRGDDCPDQPQTSAALMQARNTLRTAETAARLAEQEAIEAARKTRELERVVRDLDNQTQKAKERSQGLARRKARLEHEKQLQDQKVQDAQAQPNGDDSADLEKQAELDRQLESVTQQHSEAEAELQTLTQELSSARNTLDTASTAEKTKQRDSVVKSEEAKIGAEEYTDARVIGLRRPFDVGVPANANARNALERVEVRTAGPARLRLTGLPKDVNLVSDLIRDQIDVPTAQARITLWRLQVSGEKAKKLESVVRTIEESMSLAQGQSMAALMSLRDALRDTVVELRRQFPRKGPEVFYPEAVWDAIGRYYREGQEVAYDYEWSDAWPFNPVSATTLSESINLIILANQAVRKQILKRFCGIAVERLSVLRHQSEERRTGKRKSKRANGYYPFTQVVTVFGGIDGRLSCAEKPSARFDFQNLDSESAHLSPDQLELLRILQFFRYFLVIDQLQHHEAAIDQIMAELGEPDGLRARSEALSAELDDLERTYRGLDDADPEKAHLEDRIEYLKSIEELFKSLREEEANRLNVVFNLLKTTQRVAMHEVGPLALLGSEAREREVRLTRRGLRPRIAAANQMHKRYINAFENDIENLLIRPVLEDARQAARKHNVELGSVGRTSILGLDRHASRVDPKSSIEFDIPDPGVPIIEAIKLAENLAGKGAEVYGLASILAGKTPPTSNLRGTGGADEGLDGSGTPATPGLSGGLQSLVPDPAIYKVRSGVELVVTPVVLPDGQSVMFELDYRDTSDIREPVRADERHLGRIERHHVFTQVQDDSFEIRELSRYDTQQKVARRSGGIPLLGDIPGLKFLFGGRVSGRDSLQQSLLFISTVVYPSVDRLAGLFSPPPRKQEVVEPVYPQMRKMTEDGKFIEGFAVEIGTSDSSLRKAHSHNVTHAALERGQTEYDVASANWTYKITLDEQQIQKLLGSWSVSIKTADGRMTVKIVPRGQPGQSVGRKH